MTSNWPAMSATVLILGITGSLAQETPGQVNLARLPIATVFGSQLTRPFARVDCVRNLFDAAKESSCRLSDVRLTVRFKVPVAVSQVAVVLSPNEAAKLGAAPVRFSLALPGLDGQQYFTSPAIRISGVRTVYALPEQRDVKDFQIDFGIPGAAVEAI